MAAKGIEPRKLAYLAIRSSGDGSLESALDALLDKSDIATNDKSLTYAICMAVLRNRFKIDKIIDSLVTGKKIDDEVRDVLRIGAAQSLYLSKIPPHAIVSTAVELTKFAKKSSASGLVNAIMRKIVSQKEWDFVCRDEIERISLETSHPQWLIERWEKAQGLDFARKLATTNNDEPPFTIRTNTRLITVEDLQERFAEADISSEIDERTPEYLYIDRRHAPYKLPGWDEGLFSVQDPAFGLPVWALAPRPGERILEIGCAPGGKLSHLAEIAGGDVELHGLDISESRLATTRENLTRLRLAEDVTLHLADARQFSMPGHFDAILLDAPCTSLGVIRRHPEIRYRRSPDDIARTSMLQMELIESAIALLKPDGRLVYCSCSTEPEEGEAHFSPPPEGFEVRRIISGIPTEFIVGDFVRTWPHLHGLDGSFCAVIRRS